MMVIGLLGLGCTSGCVPLKKRSDSSSSESSLYPTLELPAVDTQRLTESVTPGPPSHNRPWRIDLAVLPYAELGKEEVTIRNVRQCRWKTETDRSVHHQDWNFRWEQIDGVDFVVVPFPTMPILAHTMLSFRLSDGRALVVSVEARLEKGEVYSPVAGAARQYELMYVIGDEQDLYGLRADARQDDIYLYRTVATAEQSRELLKGILLRTNAIAASPEYYDSLTNNCTTNIIDHVFQLRGDSPASLRLRDQWRSRFPGNSDKMAYELGLLESDTSFEELKSQAWISSRVRQHMGQEDFSALIRQTSGSTERVDL